MKKQNQSYILEITNRDQFIPNTVHTGDINIVRVKNNPLSTFSVINNTSFKIEEHPSITDNYEIIRSYLSVPEVHFYIALFQNEVIGAFDLVITPDNQIEIKNLGFIQSSPYKRYKDLFLSKAIEFSWQFNPSRIFIHSTPKSHDIETFLAKGFSVSYSEPQNSDESYNTVNTGLISNFLINYN